MPSPKKNQYWFLIDQPYMVMTASVPFVKGVIREPGKPVSRQGLTFTIDDPDLEAVTFQLTRKDKFGIFAPEGSGIEDILERVKPYLDKAAGNSVKLTPIVSARPKEFLVEGLTETAERKAPEAQKRDEPPQLSVSVENTLLVDAVKHIHAMVIWFDLATSDVTKGTLSEDYVARIQEAASSVGQMFMVVNQITKQRFPEARDEIRADASVIPEKYRNRYWRATSLESLSKEQAPDVVALEVEVGLDYASKLTKVVDRLQATLPDEEVGSFCRLVRHELKAIKTALGTT